DTQAALRYPLAAIDFGGTVGTRAGSVGPAVGGTARVWGNVSVVAWLRPRLGVVVSAGAYPVDLTQGYPGGRFISLALRVAARESRAVERAAATSTNSSSGATGEPSAASTTKFDHRTLSGTQRLLRVYAPSATTVEINADFTQWRPLPLARGSDGWWTIARAVARGTHQVNIRIDGGGWIAPPDLLATADEFGGVVGILVVECPGDRSWQSIRQQVVRRTR